MKQDKDPITIQDAVDRYINHKSAINTLSKTTLQRRVYSLKNACVFFNSIGINYVHELHRNAVVKYYEGLKVAHNSKITKILELNAFLTYLKEEGIGKDMHLNRMKPSKKIIKLQPVLFEEDINKLTDAVLDNSSEKFIDRDILIITLFLNTGIRVAELVSLDIYNVDMVNLEFKIRRKGNDEATLPFSEQIHEMLLTWLPQRESFNISPDEKALFVSTWGKRISIRTVQLMTKKNLSNALLIKSQMGPHLLRRSALTRMVEENDISTVQEIAGHKDIRTTAIYLRTNEERKRAAVSKPLKLKQRTSETPGAPETNTLP